MGIALLFWIYVLLVFGINGTSIYLFFKRRSRLTVIAAATGALGIAALLLLFWVRGGAATAATVVCSALTLVSLVCGTIVRNRDRRGVGVWFRYLLVPVFATPLLFAALIAFMEWLHEPPA